MTARISACAFEKLQVQLFTVVKRVQSGSERSKLAAYKRHHLQLPVQESAKKGQTVYNTSNKAKKENTRTQVVRKEKYKV